MVERVRVGSDQQIIAVNRLTGLVKARAEQVIRNIGWRVEGPFVSPANSKIKVLPPPYTSSHRQMPIRSTARNPP